MMNSLRKGALHLAAGFLTFFALLFGVGAAHSVLAASAMPDMGRQMAPNQCQTTCAPQQIIAAPVNHRQKQQDKEPRPAEPYYLALISVGWASSITISAAYLFGYLRWRPPDLFKLNVNYQL